MRFLLGIFLLCISPSLASAALVTGHVTFNATIAGASGKGTLVYDDVSRDIQSFELDFGPSAPEFEYIQPSQSFEHFFIRLITDPNDGSSTSGEGVWADTNMAFFGAQYAPRFETGSCGTRFDTMPASYIISYKCGEDDAFFSAGNFSYQEAISAVPLPAGIWMFGAALIGLVATAKRKKS